MGVVNITEQCNWILTQVFALLGWVGNQRFQIGTIECDVVGISISILMVCLMMWLLRKTLWE